MTDIHRCVYGISMWICEVRGQSSPSCGKTTLNLLHNVFNVNASWYSGMQFYLIRDRVTDYDEIHNARHNIWFILTDVCVKRSFANFSSFFYDVDINILFEICGILSYAGFSISHFCFAEIKKVIQQYFPCFFISMLNILWCSPHKLNMSDLAVSMGFQICTATLRSCVFFCSWLNLLL